MHQRALCWILIARGADGTQMGGSHIFVLRGITPGSQLTVCVVCCDCLLSLRAS